MTDESAEAVLSSDESKPVEVQDLIALLGQVELVAVRFLEVSAKRLVDETRGSGETEFAMQFLRRQSIDRLDLRFRMTAKSPDADYVVDVETSYSLAQEVKIPPAVLAEFVERTGAMAAFPYIREGLASSAARVGAEVPLLGLLRAGQFQVDIGQLDDEEPSSPDPS